MLGQWSYLLFAVGVLNVILGLLVLLRDWRKLVNVTFCVLSIALSVWVAGIAGFGVVTSEPAAYVFAKMFYIAPLYVGLFFVFFAKLFPAGRRVALSTVMLASLPVLALTGAFVARADFIIQDIQFNNWGAGVAVNQSQYVVYAAVVVALFGYALLSLFQSARRQRGVQKVQVQNFLAMGVVVSMVGIWFNIVLAHWLGDYRYIWVGPLATALYFASNAVSIARHRMFDIRATAVRSLTYALSIMALAAVYFGLAYLASTTLFDGVSTTGVSMSPINIALALILAFIFQPVKRFFDRLTNRLFYRDVYDADEFIAELGALLTRSTHLREMLESSLAKITRTLKASSGLFIVYRENHDDVLVGNHDYDNYTVLEEDLLHRLADICGPKLLIVDKTAYHSDPDVTRVHRLMARKRVALVMPLTSARGTVGYLLLGEQMSARYTVKDIRVLEAITSQLVIAIMNARSVQAIRDLNTHLEERVIDATRQLLRSNKRLLELDETKDEFLSMASHQLRTPLTSIKGYISMVLEGDVGNISPAQRKLLKEAYISSERMVHLISDFLNVNRLQTGKFVIDYKKTNLAKLAKQEVDSIRQIAEAHDIEVQYREPARFPELYLDEGKLRQVIMNFMDNAIYYSPEGKTIKVSLRIEAGYAVLRVVDTGMGVPASVQKKLFTKFFRAENARKQRPDGTGIGLYLAKKVVDGHGGSLVFESTEGKGSTFGFRLPVKKLSTLPEPKIVED